VLSLTLQRFVAGGEAAGHRAGAQSPVKRGIAELIRRLAPRSQVDARLAIAVALVESNLNPRARSPKDAEGVMQLIPGTQQRFGVRDPYDVEANVKGGLAYLKWLRALRWRLGTGRRSLQRRRRRGRSAQEFRPIASYVRRSTLPGGLRRGTNMPGAMSRCRKSTGAQCVHFGHAILRDLVFGRCLQP
jgi:hypothetical protein